MNKQYRLVVFDWEGTLSDTLGLILHCIATEAKKLGYGELDEIYARKIVEFGLVNALKKIFPHLELGQQEHLLSSVQQAILTRHGESFLIPGALELVRTLKEAGYFLAIASNKGPQSLQRALQSTEMDKYFDTVRAAGPIAAKPDKAMLEDILQFLNLNPNQAVMVGDSVTDMQMAFHAKVNGLGLDLYQSQAALLKNAGASEVFDNYADLAHFLLLHQEGAKA